MARHLPVALLIAVMVAVVVGFDLLFFRDRFWPRLIANIGIVAAFAAFYFTVMRKP